MDAVNIVDDDDAVKEVDQREELMKTKKSRLRVPWTEARLLCLLRTTGNYHYSTIRFNGENLARRDKLKTMKEIRKALACEPSLWPGVPLPETLDAWLDDAVQKYIRHRGKKNDKSNTCAGDDPEIPENTSRFTTIRRSTRSWYPTSMKG